MKKFNANIMKYAKKKTEYKTDGYAVNPKSPLNRCLKIAYIVVFIYNMLMLMANTMGSWMQFNEYKLQENADQAKVYAENRSLFILMFVSVILSALVFVCFIKRWKYVFVVLGIGVNVVDFVTLLGRYLTAYNNMAVSSTAGFWWTFGVTEILLFILTVLLFVMWVIYDKRLRHEYEAIESGIYSAAVKEGKVNLSGEEFIYLLDSYEGDEIEQNKPAKRSKKNRKRKEQ